MRQTRGIRGSVLALAIVSLALGRVGVADTVSSQEASVGDSGKLYLAYNIWYEKAEKIACVNYKAGAMIPAGTELAAAPALKGPKRKASVRFVTADGKTEYVIYFKQKFHPGVTIGEYRDRLFTTKTFAELTDGLTEEETEAIRKGKLIVGMSRRAVLASRGYPPEHKTSSLEQDTWLYWENRFRTKAIYFDENGRTSKAPSLDEDEL